MEEEIGTTYHGEGRELADFLDGAGRSLLEADAMNLFVYTRYDQSSVQNA